MKKYFLLTLVTSCTFIFTSCSKDDDGVDATDSQIIGAWNLTALNVNDGRVEIITDGQSIVSELEITGKDFDATVTFAEDPKTVTSEGTFNATVTTTTMGQTETEEQEGDDFFDNKAWSLNGSVLTIGTGEEEQSFTITRLTDSRMDLRYVLDETETILGFTYSSKLTYTVTLSK